MNLDDNFIVFTSNCFGEDRSAALIASVLKKKLQYTGVSLPILGASLISDGGDYINRGVDMLYTAEIPPSGGFPTRSLKGFLADLFSGSLFSPFRFINILKKNRSRIPFAVVVGDVPLLILTRLGLGKKPILFLAPAKSDYMEPHYKIEEWVIRNWSDIVLTHDEFTAVNMRSKHINALFLGNPMMDELDCKTDSLVVPEGGEVVGILPGSREEAYENFALILRVIERIQGNKTILFPAAIPASLKEDRIIKTVEAEGWAYREMKPYSRIEKMGVSVILTRGIFQEVLKKSNCIIGLAGTANEQAAGLGIPIVSFVGNGPQTTARRILEQANLLGGAMKYIKGGPDEAALEVNLLLQNPTECQNRGRTGHDRMGGPGGAENIASLIIEKYVDILLKSDKHSQGISK